MTMTSSEPCVRTWSDCWKHGSKACLPADFSKRWPSNAFAYALCPAPLLLSASVPRKVQKARQSDCFKFLAPTGQPEHKLMLSAGVRRMAASQARRSTASRRELREYGRDKLLILSHTASFLSCPWCRTGCSAVCLACPAELSILLKDLRMQLRDQSAHSTQAARRKAALEWVSLWTQWVRRAGSLVPP